MAEIYEMTFDQIELFIECAQKQDNKDMSRLITSVTAGTSVAYKPEFVKELHGKLGA